MSWHECVRTPIHMIPDFVMESHQLHNKVHNGCAHAETCKGMCGLPQGGLIANGHLQKMFAPFAHHPCAITPGSWKHNTSDLVFCLVVDNFVAQCTRRKDIDHLLNMLKTHCKVSENWADKRHCGLTRESDCENCACDISMPGCIEQALQ